MVYCRLIRRYLESKYQSTEKAERKYSSLMLLLTELAFIRETNRMVYQQMEKTKIDCSLVELYELNWRSWLLLLARIAINTIWNFIFLMKLTKPHMIFTEIA